MQVKLCFSIQGVHLPAFFIFYCNQSPEKISIILFKEASSFLEKGRLRPQNVFSGITLPIEVLWGLNVLQVLSNHSGCLASQDSRMPRRWRYLDSKPPLVLRRLRCETGWPRTRLAGQSGISLCSNAA